MQSVPFNESFEKALLVAVLSNPLMLPQVQQIVGPQDFYSVHHKDIFKVISSLNPDQLDSLTVLDKLGGDTQTYFQDLITDSDNFLPGVSNILFYAEAIRAKRKLREGISVGQNIIDICYNEEDAEEAIHRVEELFAVFMQNRVQEDRTESASKSFADFLEALKDTSTKDTKKVQTGFKELDLTIQKLEGLVILAGKSGLGKTSFAINILLNVLKANHTALMFSLEQPEQQIFERMLSVETKIPVALLREGGAYPNEYQIERAKALMENFHIDDKASVPTSYIASVARQKKLEWGTVGVIFVDYLNLVRQNSKPTVEALGDICKELRALGKELDCPVVLLAQLNRGQQETSANKKRRPELYDLRSSGEIEQVADQVLMLYRESYFELPGAEPEEDITEVLVRKNRNGSLGMIELRWLKSLTKFENL